VKFIIIVGNGAVVKNHEVLFSSIISLGMR